MMKKLTLILIGTAIPFFCFAQWSQNGNDLYYKNGNVGVGTSEPNGSFHVKGNANDPDGCIIIETFDSTSGDRDPKLIFKDDNGTELSRIAQGTSGYGLAKDLRIWNKQDGKIIFGTNNVQKVTITEDGDLLINDYNNGVILTSPNGNEYRITVDNSGNFQTNLITKRKKLKKPEHEITISPNPTNGLIEVQIQGLENIDINTKIYNSEGKLLLLKNHRVSQFTIDISDFVNGIYFLQINDTDGNLLKTEKIVKE